MRPKRSEVAGRAGVSEATVSYVFSGKRYVSDDLKKRVMRVADDMGYQPDLIASTMVTNESQTIAVLTSDIASSLQMEVIKGIQSAAMEKGYFVNICGGMDNLERYIDNFIARRVDGVFISVISPLVSDNYLKKLLNRGISVIITSSRAAHDDRICGLELDFNKAIKLLVEHLGQLGHKKIAYLSSFDEKYNSDRRLQAYYDCMAELGEKPMTEKGSFPFDSTIESGYSLMNRLIKSGRKFTAVICTNDLMAFGAIQSLNEHKLSVPQDISVTGIDDIAITRAFSPPLTTISHCSDEYGRKIFEILYDNIHNKDIVRREMVSPKLVVRASTCYNFNKDSLEK